MTDTSGQIKVEQERVSAMYERLDAEVSAVRARLAELGAPTPGERAPTPGERAPTPGERAALSGEQAALAGALARRLSDLHAAEAALCFGRIDHGDGTTLHIGRRGLWVGGEPLLVDWRAAASRPFYAATPAYPMGLRRRRHLRVADRLVRGLADEILDGEPPGADDVLGDGPLAEALSATRTGRMQAAVTTLQVEQDAIVRSPDRGVTVVQGGPGTGKTVVALHRAAYVLFAFPAAAAQGVLVVGPDARFLDYISQVLPSLGENGVRLATRTGITGAEPSGSEPEDLARLKGRAELAGGLTDWVRARQPAATAVRLPVGPDVIELDAAVVAEALAAARGLPHNRGRIAFKEYLVAELVRERARSTEAELARIDAETAELVGFDLDKAVAADLRSLGLDGARGDGPGEEADDPVALRAALLRDEPLDRAVTALWPALTPAAAVTGLLADPAAHLPSLGPGEQAALRRAPGTPWTSADLALLDEAGSLLDGPPDQVYGHVVVDEAQELTEMEWRMVIRRCPARSMTVVGDFAQAGPGSTARGWSDALGPHVGARFAVHTLTVNYRTTAEILDGTRDLLAEIAPEQAPARSLRHGEMPRVRHTPAARLAEAVLDELRIQAANHPGELIAVIAADATADRLAGTAVAGLARVVPVSAARGLEFDSVLVVSPEEIVAARASGRRDLYVALTRATRRVCVFRT